MRGTALTGQFNPRNAAIAAGMVLGTAACGLVIFERPIVSLIPPLPVLLDYRSLVADQDLSNLTTGPVRFEFDAYTAVNKGVSWSSDADNLIWAAARVAELNTGDHTATKVVIQDLDHRNDMRHVIVTADLPHSGVWVVRLTSTSTGRALVPPGYAAPLTDYDPKSPETFPDEYSAAARSAGHALRTVGSCNHLRMIRSSIDANNTYSAMEFEFSEVIPPGLAIGAHYVSGNGQAEGELALPPLETLSANTVRVALPSSGWNGTTDLRITFHLTSTVAFAGAFNAEGSCEAAPYPGFQIYCLPGSDQARTWSPTDFQTLAGRAIDGWKPK